VLISNVVQSGWEAWPLPEAKPTNATRNTTMEGGRRVTEIAYGLQEIDPEGKGLRGVMLGLFP